MQERSSDMRDKTEEPHPAMPPVNSQEAAPRHHPMESSRTLFTVMRMLCANDPSAGSPTETLLRLLLPLSDKVH